MFLDANVLFSAAYRHQSGLCKLWELPDVVLLTSEYAVEEARRNLSGGQQKERLNLLLGDVEVVQARSIDNPLRGDIELREKDWPILSGAVTARASHLITGDVRDFGRYFGSKIFGILVLRPVDFLRFRAPQ